MEAIVATHLHRVGTDMGLEPIPEGIIVPFLQERARSNGKKFADGAGPLVYRVAEGIPIWPARIMGYPDPA